PKRNATACNETPLTRLHSDFRFRIPCVMRAQPTNKSNGRQRTAAKARQSKEPRVPTGLSQTISQSSKTMPTRPNGHPSVNSAATIYQVNVIIGGASRETAKLDSVLTVGRE